MSLERAAPAKRVGLPLDSGIITARQRHNANPHHRMAALRIEIALRIATTLLSVA